MALNYAYHFAYIDPATNMCIQVSSRSNNDTGDDPYCIPIPVYDEEYLFKFYIDGYWYEDPAGTIPWASTLE